MSTLTHEYDILHTLRTDSSKSLFLEIPTLGAELSEQIITDWLRHSRRALTKPQMELVREVLAKNSLPLHTRLVFDSVCTWRSFQMVDKSDLQPTVTGAQVYPLFLGTLVLQVLSVYLTGVIEHLFDRMERYHGQIFTSHALSYLTASKSGLSDVEMEDVLSLDDDVCSQKLLLINLFH